MYLDFGNKFRKNKASKMTFLERFPAAQNPLSLQKI